MRLAGALLLTAVLAAPAAAEVTVRVVPGAPGSTPSVELTARQAPLAEVLDRLSRQIGMKVVYEGASPRQLVTVSLQGRTPSETVLALFEGTGVNFALQSDPTGARVEMLLVAGSAPQTASTSSSSSPSSGTGRSLSPGTFRRPSAPPGSGPDAIEEEPEDIEEEEIDEPPEAPEQPERPERPPMQQPGDPAGAVQPVGPQAPAPPQGFAPTTSFPVSPFAPQATQPYAPQTFPPLPPGVQRTPPPDQQQQQPQQQPETTGQPPPD